MAGEAAASVAINERIDMLDLLRGVAICGILLMNIPEMGMLWSVTHPPYPAGWTLDWVVYAIQNILFSGSMRGLFTLLFGAGMLVMLRRTEREGLAAPMDVFVRRCIALMFLGIVQFAVFLWPGEILFNYGLTGFFILAFRKAKAKILLIVALVMLTLFSLANIGQAYAMQGQVDSIAAARKLQAEQKPLTGEQRKAIENAQQQSEERNPSPATITKEVRQRIHFPSVLGWSATTWAKYNISGIGWFGRIESFIFMLVGMALFRMGILTGDRSMGFYAKLTLIGYGIGFPIRAVATIWNLKMGLGFDFGTVLFGGLTYEGARLAVTVGHVGLLCWLFKAGALGRAWPARALGRMALTTYSLQSILTSILFYGFGYVNQFGFAALMAIAIDIWIVTGLFAVWWLRGHDQGPAEWLLRRLAYGKRAEGPRAVPGPDGTLATA